MGDVGNIIFGKLGSREIILDDVVQTTGGHVLHYNLEQKSVPRRVFAPTHNSSSTRKLSM